MVCVEGKAVTSYRTPRRVGLVRFAQWESGNKLPHSKEVVYVSAQLRLS